VEHLAGGAGSGGDYVGVGGGAFYREKQALIQKSFVPNCLYQVYIFFLCLQLLELLMKVAVNCH
jgi:hypothetical protein